MLTLKRVYVDKLTGGETAAQMRDILISSLQESKLFIVTENQEKADAVIHAGAAEDLVFTETHSSSDGINARFNHGFEQGRYPDTARTSRPAWASGIANRIIRRCGGMSQSLPCG